MGRTKTVRGQSLRTRNLMVTALGLLDSSGVSMIIQLHYGTLDEKSRNHVFALVRGLYAYNIMGLYLEILTSTA